VKNEVTEFDYMQVDGETAKFLKKKETNIHDIVGKAETEVGRELKEAQDELAKHGYGCFIVWTQHVGMKKDKVYDLIYRFKLIFGNSEKRELLEGLPISLSCKIGRPNSESTEAKRKAKQAVLDGEVKTLKEYSELEKRLEGEEKARQQVESELDAVRRSEQIAIKRAEEAESREPQVEVRTEYIYEESPKQDDVVRKVDPEQRKEFYSEFIHELEYIREKYGAVALEGGKLREAVENDDDLCEKLDGFDDFWNTFSKSIFKNQTIVEVGN
jgi:hypothetical protein